MEKDMAAMACVTRLNLASIRGNRGLSLHDIAEDTKISARYLRAIEDERFDALPGRIYSVNYIRQYAEAIDYDVSAILLLFKELSTDSFAEASTLATEPLSSALRLRGERYWRAITALLSDAAGQG